MTIDFWNDRYKEEGYAYGAMANVFISSELKKLKPGGILFPAEGEGRNAVYAVEHGWQVDAFDLSDVGRDKALQLAGARADELNYTICDASAFLKKTTKIYDVVAFCYTHFPGVNRLEEHKALAGLVRPGGIAIMEVFAKGHTQYNERDPRVGGPKDESMLFDIEEARIIFEGFNLLHCEECEVLLNEGKYHIGVGKVLRIVAKRKN